MIQYIILENKYDLNPEMMQVRLTEEFLELPSSAQKDLYKLALFAINELISELEEIEMIDLNKLAVEITEMEGLKESLTIAQVKEVIACLGIRWRKMGHKYVDECLYIRNNAGVQSEHKEDA